MARRPRKSVQDIDRREVPVLQELQRRPAAGTDVADLVGEAELLDGGGAVAAADDRGSTVLLRGVGHRLGDGYRAVLEGLLLEYAHGAVPDDGFRLADFLGVDAAGLRA